MVKRGFEGRIIVPEGNKELFKVMCLDSARIMERDAEDLSRKLKKDVPPIYEEHDVHKAYGMVEEFLFNEKIKLDDEVSFQFIPAQHIIASAQLILWITNKNVTRKIAFTGDLGNLGVPNLYCNTFEPIPNANLLVGECTYANKDKSIKAKDREKDLEKIKSIVYDTCIDSNGKILFPSFSLMRSQVILTVLYDMFKDDEKFNVPVVVASPLTCKINKLFYDMLEGEQLAKWEEVTSWNKAKFIDNFEELDAMLKQDVPMILICSSGMMNAGFSVACAERLLPHAKNCICFIGYSVEGTLSWKIKQKKTKTVSINGKAISSRCKVINLHSFSSHIQRDDIIKYYSGGFGSGSYGKICLQHGSMKDRVGLASDLQEAIEKRNRTDKVVVVNKSTEILL